MDVKTAAFDSYLKTVNVVHRSIKNLSGGRLLGSVGSMTVVELHTTGRTSGKRRTTMLTTPIHDDGCVVLVASKGGDDRDPDWYRNLVADPNVEVAIDGATTKMTARTAADDEKAGLWPSIVEVYKGYAGYQDKTDREIPVVICTPIS
jgi:deazaflavin-dependent oxidoreductase (nitroreductase family)